jgi:hypothetical protein
VFSPSHSVEVLVWKEPHSAGVHSLGKPPYVIPYTCCRCAWVSIHWGRGTWHAHTCPLPQSELPDTAHWLWLQGSLQTTLKGSAGGPGSSCPVADAGGRPEEPSAGLS